MIKANSIPSIIVILALAVGAFVVAKSFDFSHLLMAPICLFWLVTIWKNQAIGFFLREDDPYIFWLGVALLTLVLMFFFWDIAHYLGLIQ